jgi:hypothetical protein
MPERTRRDWRETVSAATDFALLGILVTVVSVFVVTLGAALATGSAAAAHWCRYRSLPPVRDLLAIFVRALAPGALATLVAAVAGALLGADLTLVGRGVVPGGRVFLVVSVVIAAEVAGLATLVLVGVGEREGTGFRDATRWAGRIAFAAPLAPLALAAVLAIAALIAVMVPVTTPILLGFVLLAVHVVARRTVPARLE